ncbi:unnamed protein product, partial [Mesorhabditis spiculigera]
MQDVSPSYTCQVCLLPAPGYHFSVISCRACAAFFRRAAVLQITYVCQSKKACDVTKKNRFSCRSCRYQKCWDLGMRPSMIKQMKNGDEDEEESAPRLKKKRKNTKDALPDLAGIPGPSGENSESATTAPAAESELKAESIDGHQEPAAVVQKMSDEQQQLKDRVDQMFLSMVPLPRRTIAVRLSLMQRALLAFDEHIKKWPMCTPENVKPGEPFTIAEIMGNAWEELENVAVFCMSMEEFAKLEREQKWVLFKRFWKLFTMLERFRTTMHCFDDPPDTRMLLYDGTYYDFEDQRIWTRRSSNLKKIIDFAAPMIEQQLYEIIGLLRRTAPTDFELIFCALHILWNTSDSTNLTKATLKSAEAARKTLSTEIHEYYTTELNRPNYAARLMKVMKIVAVFDEAARTHAEARIAFRTFEFLPKEYLTTDFYE